MTRRDRRGTLRALALLACIAVGCADDVRGQIVVVVASDMRVPDELDEVGVTVIGPLGARALDERFALGAGGVALPLSFGVAPTGGDTSRVVTIEVEARRAGDTLFRVRRRTQFVAGEIRQLVVFLAGHCEDDSGACTDDTTCELAGCVPELVDVRSLPRYAPNAPLPDAGPARDAGVVRDAADMASVEPDLGGDDLGIDDAGDDDLGIEEDLGIDDDAGPIDMGPMDAAPRDLGPADVGPMDSGPVDLGSDAGPVDLGAEDAGGGDAGMCAESPCRVVAPQCGCAGALGCTFRPDGMSECRVLGSRTAGAACSDDSLACAPGLGCISTGGPAVCRTICEAPSDCAAMTSCVPITGFGGYGSCQPGCDLADVDACGGGTQGCTLADTITGARAPICAAVGSDPIGTPCSGNTCAPGLACVTPPGMTQQCRPWCRRPGPCGVGEGTCTPVDPAPIFDGVEYGICVP